MAIIRICQLRKKEKLNFALSIHKEERMVISDYVVEKKKKKKRWKTYFKTLNWL